MGSKVGKILGAALPVVAPLLLGPAGFGLTGASLLGGSAAAGAAGGLLSGGGLKDAFLGGVTGALGGGGGSAIAKAAGLSGAGASALSGGLTGAASGLASGGGLKNALLGAALGGAGGYALDGGIGGGGSLGAGGMGPPTPTLGDKLSMGVGKATGLSGSGSGGFSNLLKGGSTILSGIQSYGAQDEMKKQLLEAQGRSEAALAPYAQAGLKATGQLSDRLADGFDPGDLSSDPGYQFQLEEAQKALGRQAAAGGNYYSGAALKAASDRAQALADTTYNDAYSRWLQGNQQLASASGQGLNATGAMTNVYDNQGNIGANATLAKNNILNSTLSRILNGSGARQVVGYRTDGTPIYADEGQNNYKLVAA